MGNSSLLERVAVGLSVGCALVVTTLLVQQRLLPRANGSTARPEPETIPAEDWQAILAGGHRMGAAAESSRVVIVEFSDFECPACKAFTQGALREMRAKYPRDVAVVYRHWPLPYHRFAYPAARASNCAADQGAFESFHDLLFTAQDSFGLKPWREFAKDAGVADLDEFEACAARAGADPLVDADSAMAMKVGGTGTPTVVINGIKWPGAPDARSLDSIVRSFIKD